MKNLIVNPNLHEWEWKKSVGVELGIGYLVLTGLNYVKITGLQNVECLEYLVLPIAWMLVAAISKNNLGKFRPLMKNRVQSKVQWEVINISSLVIISYFFIGFISGFGNNPQAVTLGMVLINSWTVIPKLIATEYVRSYLIGCFVKEIGQRRILIIGIVLGGLNVWWIPINQLGDTMEIALWSIGRVMPEIVRSIIATYFVIYGGVQSSLSYLLITRAGEWASPILPNINSFTKGIFEVVTGIIIYYLITKTYRVINKEEKRLKKIKELEIGFIGIGLLSIAIIWFSIGAFPMYPSVIVSGSMRPYIEVGDILLLQKVKDTKEIEVEDIIQFEQDEVLVSHRVVKIANDNEESVYYTKGDNNVSIDTQVVKANQIKGRVITTIPKLGWLSITVRKGLDLSK